MVIRARGRGRKRPTRPGKPCCLSPEPGPPHNGVEGLPVGCGGPGSCVIRIFSGVGQPLESDSP